MNKTLEKQQHRARMKALMCRISHARMCFGVSVFLCAFVKLEVIPHPWTLYSSQFYMKQDKDGENTSMTKALDKKWQHLQLLSSTCLKEWCQLTFPCVFPLGHLFTFSVCDMLQPFSTVLFFFLLQMGLYVKGCPSKVWTLLFSTHITHTSPNACKVS